MQALRETINRLEAIPRYSSPYLEYADDNQLDPEAAGLVVKALSEIEENMTKLQGLAATGPIEMAQVLRLAEQIQSNVEQVLQYGDYLPGSPLADTPTGRDIARKIAEYQQGGKQ